MTFSHPRLVALLAPLLFVLAACGTAPADGPKALATPPATAAAAPAAAAPASASAVPTAGSADRQHTRFHVPAPRTGPGGSTHGARHGGLVLSDQGVDVELDAQPDQLDLWMREGDKDVDLSGATGHITLLNGVDITDAYLDPSADKQRLTIRGDYKLVHGTRIVVRVTLADKRRLTLRYLIVMLPPKTGLPAAAPAASGS